MVSDDAGGGSPLRFRVDGAPPIMAAMISAIGFAFADRGGGRSKNSCPISPSACGSVTDGLRTKILGDLPLDNTAA